jgi:hypothetical protein
LRFQPAKQTGRIMRGHGVERMAHQAASAGRT